MSRKPKGGFANKNIEMIMQYVTTSPPLSLKGIFFSGPEDWPKGVKPPLNILRILTILGVPIAASILYADGAKKYAAGDTPKTALFTSAALGSNILQNALFVQKTFASFKNKHERNLVGDERSAWISNLPLALYILASAFPAASVTMSFLGSQDTLSGGDWILALLIQVANMFMYTFALRSLSSDIQAWLVRSWHERGFPFCCLPQTEYNKDRCANYLLQDRMTDMLVGVQKNIVRNRDRQNFPANLLALTAEHNYDPLDAEQRRVYAMSVLTAKAKISGVIDVIGHPDYAHDRRVNKGIQIASKILGLAGAEVVAASLLGFLVGTDLGMTKIALEPAIKTTIALIGDVIQVLFMGLAGWKCTTQIVKTAINICRGKFDPPWVLAMYPITTIGFVFIPGIYFALPSYASAVRNILKIPLGHKLLGFIPLPQWLISACEKQAYVGIPLVNGYFNIVTLMSILEVIVTLNHCYGITDRLYARLARALDQGLEFITSMDPNGLFGNEVANLINIPTNTAHFGVTGGRATNVYEDLTMYMPRPNVLVHRASGARREQAAARNEQVPLRPSRFTGTMFGGGGVNAEEGMEEEAPKPARDRCCTIL